MTGNEDNAVLVAGVFRNDVMNRELPFRSIRGEDIVLYIIALEMASDVVFHFLMCGTAEGPRPEFHDVFDVLHGAVAICDRNRASIRRVGGLLNYCRGTGLGILILSLFLIAIAGQKS